MTDRDNDVTVTFAGSGDAFASGGRCQACIHLRPARGPAVLLDCGATSLVALRRLGFEPQEIAAVFVSHLHGDHFGGLPFLILDGQFRRRTLPLTVVGPVGIERRLTEAMEVMFPGSSTTRRRFDVRVVELDGGTSAHVDGVDVTAYEVRHPSGAPPLALRLDFGATRLAYTGDTAWTDAIVTAADGAHLLIAEAYYFDKDIPYHLNYRTLAEHRHELSCARIIVTHMSVDALSKADLMNVECAHDGRILKIP